VGNPGGQSPKCLGQGEIERPSPVQGPQNYVDFIGELCVRSLRTPHA